MYWSPDVCSSDLHQVPNFNRCVDGSAVGLVHFERCCGGIVEQDVDFAEATDDLTDAAFDRVRIAAIEMQAHRTAADAFGGRLGAILEDIGDHDGCALVCGALRSERKSTGLNSS